MRDDTVGGHPRDQEPRPHDAEIVQATLMRRVGASGVQTHAATFETYLRSHRRPVATVNPFDSRSLLVKPVFAARYGIAPISGSGDVWWYRHWHEHYLRSALRRHLSQGVRQRVIYAQCPVSAAAALRVRTNEPVVMVVHFNISQADEWAHDKGLIRDDGILFRSIRSLERRVLPSLDGIVYVSEFMRDVLEERLPPLHDVPSEVIPNFVDVRAIDRRTATGDLITVGALEPRKNHQVLLDIVAAASAAGHRYRLTIVGEGPDRAMLERHAARLGISRQVTFTGYHPDPRRLMAEHRVYCHTSRMESFGIVLIEAMSTGLPVMAAPTGAIPEIVRPGVDGYLWRPDDPDEAAQQLIRVLETPGLADSMGEAGRQRVEERYSDRVLGARLEDFLLRCERRRDAPPTVAAPGDSESADWTQM